MILLQRILFGVVAGFWLAAGMLAAFGAMDLGMTDGARFLGVLMLGNGVALALAGWLSLRGHRLVDGAALAIVAANALLSVTDEIGLLDILSLAVNAVLFILLVSNLRSMRKHRQVEG